MQELFDNSGIKVSKVVQPLIISTRIVWPEYLTILSSFAVIWAHVTFRVISNTTDSYIWWVSNIADSMVRWPVPIFVMLSGYFLLDLSKDYTFIPFYKKRASRILVPLIFWSIFYIAFTVIREYLNNESVGLKDFISPILAGRPFYHMWYLYMLVGLYLFTPFFRKIVSSSNKHELTYLSILLFLFSMLVDAANYFYFDIFDPATNGSLFITWFLSYSGYFLAGYLLGRIFDTKISLYILISVLIASISINAVGCYFLTEKYSYDLGQFLGSGLSPTVVVISLSVFLIAKKLLTQAPRVKLISSVSTSMLGVYVMHPFFIDCLRYLGFDAIKFNPVIGIPLVTLCVFIICLVIAEAIKRIPILNKVI